MPKSSDHPWLRRDTLFSDTGGGLQLANATTGFEIRGGQAYQLFRKVHPMFDGSATLGQLQGATGPRWRVVEPLLEPLTAHGFLRWIPDQDFAQVEPAVREAHRDQISFLAQFTDTPHAAFARFAQTHIEVPGKSPLAESLRDNLVANGAHVTSPDGHAGDPGSPAPAPSLVVLEPGELHRLASLPADMALPVVAHETRWFVLPHRWSADDPVDWLAGARCLHESSGDLGWERLDQAGQEWLSTADPRTLAEPIQRLLGALLAYEIFKGVTGAIGAETAQGLIVLDALTGEADSHRVVPAADWGAPQPVEPPAYSPHPISLTGTVDDSRADEWPAFWQSLTDPLTLPAQAFTDLELEQLPWRVSRLDTTSGMVHAASLWTTADARIEALTTAYERHFEDCAPPLSGVIGVGRNLAEASRRALLRAVVRHALLQRGANAVGRLCEIEGDSAPAEFARTIAPGVRYADLGEYADWRVGLAFDDDGWSAAAGADLEQALIASVTSLMGGRQAGAAPSDSLSEQCEGEQCEGEQFLGDANPAAVRFRCVELPNARAQALGLTVVCAMTEAPVR